MEQARISVPALNLFAKEYISGSKQTARFFDYQPFSQSDFKARVEEVQKRSFKRMELAGIIRKYMELYQITEEVERSLQKLTDPSSLAVIGGQQAGLLTGPLYSVHKIISIITLAKEQEEKLGIPVVPIFWIAGEDHDLHEINHVYVEKSGQLQKAGYPERFLKKQAASETVYNKQTMIEWVTSIFACLKETRYTNQLLKDVIKAVNEQSTFTGFFASLTAALFSRYGLLLIDAADPALRALEAPFFKQLILQNNELSAAVAKNQNQIRELNFQPVIETSENPANLFLIEEGERHLLEKSNGLFISKSGRSYTENELLQLLESTPEAFSNNVVTRPLMQEWLFPTLAFIAGPGEIAYWAELHEAFHYFQMKMPVIVPRLNITIVERSIASIAAEANLSIESIIQNGVQEEKELYIESIRDQHLHDLVSEMKHDLMKSYEKIEARAGELHNGLSEIVKKNKQYHERQIDFLIQKSDMILEQTHSAALLRYDRLESSLHPEGLQERKWNIYPFLNSYGPDLLHQMMKQSFQHDGSHYLLFI